MAQEHKAKSTINTQLSSIQSTINDIIQEIKDINHIINLEHPTTTTSSDMSNQEGLEQMVESIKSCSSLDQFINNNKSIICPQAVDDNQSSLTSALNDKELLTMIKNHTQHMKLVKYDDFGSSSMLKPYQVKIDQVRLNNIKKQLTSCLRLASPPVQTIIPREFQNCLVSIKDKQMYLLSLKTMRWNHIQDAFKYEVSCQPNSIVYARGNIYVFGGKSSSSSSKYMRYSLAEKQCYVADIIGIIGGCCISVCYDGDEFIYLVGGDISDFNLDRVDRFSIDTQQFEHVGYLPFSVASPFTHLHNDTLYIMSGFDPCREPDHQFMAYNIHTGASRVDLEDRISYASCFDGNDSLCPLKDDYHQTVYVDPEIGILSITGNGQNYQYSIVDDKWTLMKDLDLWKRFNHGGCLIR
ncbi:hypothetical protein SAMD00019534_067180 [Acytostelium subglobosum LB1]|uniref:hypothetical protein n=1 Tax=Acytostelium subglobosum LB1 TaxID=1410327 RepID=UPI000644B80E|nr:hypothetical protein SAMD00019534_067180 [Acytostelium subglobosum LB1]GAM23543.1 hypothetical protein SAMD00019534_067180 [Acytostelium subglobosum LB1]|eukprot:XP_012753284.1 hypothetical protein SAMD00019534_067180 [Acytostelium subglobosum LB1]